MKKYNIVIYNDKASHASSSSLKEEFQRALGPLAAETEIIKASAEDILSGKVPLNNQTLAFVLPGIVGENSLYHEHLGAKGNQIIRDYVEKDGGLFMGLCAGAYYAAEKIEYVPEWAPEKGRTTGILSLFNGLARGPVPSLGISSTTPSYNGCTTAPVILDDGKKGCIAYSCGPAFFGVPADANILAYYDTPDKPIAAFSARAGKGTLLLSGVLPQYGVPDGWKQPLHPHQIDRLIAQLKPHEQIRRHLWDQMVEIIARKIRPAEKHLPPMA